MKEATIFLTLESSSGEAGSFKEMLYSLGGETKT